MLVAGEGVSMRGPQRQGEQRDDAGHDGEEAIGSGVLRHALDAQTTRDHEGIGLEPHRGGDADHEEEAASAEHDPSRGSVDEVPGRPQVGRDAMEHDERTLGACRDNEPTEQKRTRTSAKPAPTTAHAISDRRAARSSPTPP